MIDTFTVHVNAGSTGFGQTKTANQIVVTSSLESGRTHAPPLPHPSLGVAAGPGQAPHPEAQLRRV